MSNNILAGVQSANSAKLAQCKADMDIAKARNFYGVRVNCSLGAYGDASSVPTTYLAQAVTYAASIGLSKVSILLNYDPKFNGAHVVSLNGGATYAIATRPPAGPGNAVWIWIAAQRQSFVDAARAAAIAAGKDPTTFLEFEFSNEQDKGGVSGPKDASGNYSGVYATYDYGYIEPAWFLMAKTIEGLMNYHGVPTVLYTFEDDSGDSNHNGTIDAQVEVDSWTGGDATTLASYSNVVGMNCYGAPPATPYDVVATQAAFSTKVSTGVGRIHGNSLLSAKSVKVREFGIDKDKCPSCTTPNEVRNDLVAQMKVEASIVEASFYRLTNISGSTGPGSDFHFYAYSTSGVPNDGVVVAP